MAERADDIKRRAEDKARADEENAARTAMAIAAALVAGNPTVAISIPPVTPSIPTPTIPSYSHHRNFPVTVDLKDLNNPVAHAPREAGSDPELDAAIAASLEINQRHENDSELDAAIAASLETDQKSEMERRREMERRVYESHLTPAMRQQEDNEVAEALAKSNALVNLASIQPILTAHRIEQDTPLNDAAFAQALEKQEYDAEMAAVIAESAKDAAMQQRPLPSAAPAILYPEIKASRDIPVTPAKIATPVVAAHAEITVNRDDSNRFNSSELKRSLDTPVGSTAATHSVGDQREKDHTEEERIRIERAREKAEAERADTEARRSEAMRRGRERLAVNAQLSSTVAQPAAATPAKMAPAKR